MPQPTTNNLEGWVEEFNKLGFYELEEIDKPFESNQEIIKLRNKDKQFISDLLKKEAPYSVSEWMKVGKERGYWDYFKEENKIEAKKIFDLWCLNFDIKDGCGERPDFDSLLYAFKFFIKKII